MKQHGSDVLTEVDADCETGQVLDKLVTGVQGTRLTVSDIVDERVRDNARTVDDQRRRCRVMLGLTIIGPDRRIRN